MNNPQDKLDENLKSLLDTKKEVVILVEPKKRGDNEQLKKEVYDLLSSLTKKEIRYMWGANIYITTIRANKLLEIAKCDSVKHIYSNRKVKIKE